MFTRFFSLALIALSLGFGAYAHSAGHYNLRHHELARRASSAVQLHKRFDVARWTFYAVGLGACGKVSKPSDFIVALNTPQFGSGYPGPNCFKEITMIYNGKTTTAIILDECPGCPYGGLDLSPGLFTFFAAEAEGVLYGTWYFSDGSGGGGETPTSKRTHKWSPPTPSIPVSIPPVWSPSPTPTTTWTPTSTHTTSTWSSQSSSSANTSPSIPPPSINYSTGAASGLAVPTGTVTIGTNELQNIDLLNLLIVSFGSLITVAHSTTT